MNFEEMLNAKEGAATHREDVPLGVFYKKLIDKKYRNVLELRPELTDNIVFCEGLKADQKKSTTITGKGQLHYELHSDSNGIYELEIEQGNFQTFAQLIDNTPAVVATPDYLDETVNTLLDITEQLHQQDICHVCYAPQEIYARKSDNSPLLLCHGSSFKGMKDLSDLYGGFEAFIAPEVIGEGVIDERSDVYALGCFVKWLFQHADMPYEYKKMVNKATQADPAKRFASIAEMRDALKQSRSLKRSAITFAAAVAVVALCIGLYFELMPQTEDIEFIEGAPKEDNIDEILDDGFDPETELGLWVDSVDTLSNEERMQMEAYMKKAEDIFRRQYTQEANRIMSKLYTKQGMSLSENAFIASSNAMTEELIKAQQRLAGDAGISDDRAVRIAAEVNDILAEQLQKNLQQNGYQKSADGE
jgi:serine/threonine protein kinase